MVFELHIWGPAFGLPSIDAECIAAVAYLNRALLQHQWKLVANHDASLSPNHDFPALRDGSTWIAGFNTIVRHLDTHPEESYVMDRSLSSGRAHPDYIAFSTLIQSNAQPLLDLSLYTIYENYTSTTRPAFTKILPWYANYIIPPSRRAAAKARTQHLGLSSLDPEPSDEAPKTGSISSQYDAAKRAASTSTTGKGPSLLPLGNRKKAGGLLGQTQHADRFKLDNLANALFMPLDDLLAEKKYLLSDEEPSSLDCLALGYLSLMLDAPVPQAWLSETLKTRFRKLEEYVRRLRETMLGFGDNAVETIMAMSERSDPADGPTVRQEEELKLPWSESPQKNAFDVAVKVGWDVIEALPGPRWKSLVQHAPAEAPLSSAHRVSTTHFTRSLAVWSAGLVGLIGGIVFSAVWWGHESQENYKFESARPHQPTTLAELGEAGAALAALGNQLALEAAYQRERERMGGAPVMEVDVEVEPKGADIL